MSDGLPSVSVVHKAIRNYLVNELGIHRASLEQMIKDIVKTHVDEFFQSQLATRGSYFRKTFLEVMTKSAEAYLQRNLSVALAKVETKAEIMIVDGRMNEP